MKNELKQDFTRRLSQCNAGEMIVIIYDILFAYLDDVKGAYEEDSHEQMKVAIRRAQNVLDELIHSLIHCQKICIRFMCFAKTSLRVPCMKTGWMD